MQRNLFYPGCMFHIPYFYDTDCVSSYHMLWLITWKGFLFLIFYHSSAGISLDRMLFSSICESPAGLFTDSWASNLPYDDYPQLLLPAHLSPLAHTRRCAHTQAVVYDAVVPQLPTSIDQTTDSIPKARWTWRHIRRWGRGFGSRSSCKLQNCESSCTIPRGFGSRCKFRRYMGIHRPTEPLATQAERLTPEALQEARTRGVGLTMSSGKHLRNSKGVEMRVLHGTFSASDSSPFPSPCLARWLLVNVVSMRV